MPSGNYLNQYIANGVAYCEVIDVDGQSFAIFMGSDPSVITCEKTSVLPGIYNTESIETPINDPNIVNVVKSWYSRISSSGMNIRSIAKEVLKYAASSKKKRVAGVSRMTKSLATGLSSIKELMTFYEDTDSYEFLCFGYRSPIAEFLEEKGYKAFYLFPERFYTAALFESRFKNDHWMSCYRGPIGEVLILTNKKEDKFSLMMSVEWKTHSEFITRSFAENEND